MKRLIFLVVILVLLFVGISRSNSAGMYNIAVIDNGQIIQEFTSKNHPIRRDGYWTIQVDIPERNYTYELHISDRALIEWSIEKIVTK